ncbi:glutamyl-Q tRNA(Asp) synthetase [Chitinivorax tropicus]|uniref:Glutamyl-Q tRNA(Asp) synthetase n=1 Tax=Chitinivorax tropicus TaxID=714531 RepID=A0A840MYC3_9PROT|nr:tRNA glutamyl-Q(34) synthetase GluQRS [Chitinivorax tropicus]MBB5020151.1 glutamyl-Q tRNA(Asp) synthetase [Chitinivorax tropicus]
MPNHPTPPAPYRGRFAPTPSGPLHFGSLVAAVGSYLDAKAQQGEWLLRIEDLDPPRAVAGSIDDILKTLERFGFEWDGPILYQSQRFDLYQAALEKLLAQGLLYGCACSRKEIADSAAHGLDGLIYPGTCRRGLAQGKQARAWRILVPSTPICFEDRVLGTQTQNLATEIGDFILKRADGLFSYQLAVVVDDAETLITDIVRGADLLLSTARQLFLQNALGYPTPHHAHLPLALNRQGDKLSKQNLAKSLADQPRSQALADALTFLGHPPPTSLLGAPLRDLWAWAIKHWQLKNVPIRASNSPLRYDEAKQAKPIFKN